MNPEVWIIICAGVGLILFALGGTEISPSIKGMKWLRRFVLPIVLGIIAAVGGVQWDKCILMTLCLSASLHLGYGHTKPYWYKFIVGCLYTASTLWLGFTYWQIITPLCFIGMFKLSNMKFFDNIFVWKALEAITGMLIGLTVGMLIAYRSVFH